jgi:hypothetical protein
MTIAFLLAAAAVVLAPLLVRRLWQSTRKVVYEGPTSPSTMLTEDLGKISKARYCWISIPQHDRALLAEVSPNRWASIGHMSTTVQVTVVKHLFGAPKVESITWPDESRPQSADNAPKIGLMSWYFLTGLGALVLAVNWSKSGSDFATMSMLSNYLSAILLAFAGFFAVMNYEFDNSGEHKVELLGVTVGKGKRGMVFAVALAIALTAVSFTWVNILTIVIGLNTAIAAGGLCAILWKMRRNASASQNGRTGSPD